MGESISQPGGSNEHGHGRYDRHEAADISRPRRALPEHCALQLRHHPFLRGSDRHLSRLYEALRPLGFPAPLAWAYFLGVLEFFGGAALAVGFLMRPLALMFTVQMAIVTYWHAGNGYFFSSPRGGWEFPLLLTILYAAIFFRGAGRCAVDRMIGKEF